MAAATRSQAERLWLAGGALVAFLLLVIGYFLFIGPQRADTSSVNSSLSSARMQNAHLESRITSLRRQSLDMASVQTKLAAAQHALPSTSGMSDFLRTLQSLGNSTSAHVVSLTVGAPTDVTAIASGPTAAAGTSPTSTPAPAASTGATATGTTTAAAPATGPSVYGLTIAAQVSGSPAALNRFLQQLQGVQPRAVLITQITEGSGLNGTAGTTTGGTTTSGTALQLTMQAFVAPSSVSENANLAAAAGH